MTSQQLRDRVARIGADTFAIRDGLYGLIDNAPAGGLFNNPQIELQDRNSFAVRLDPDGPIFTVTISYGGTIRSTS